MNRGYLRATLCILDPRLLLDEKSASNENFRDQLAAADIIVANKSDRATPESEQALQRWWQQNGGDRQLIHSEHGKVDGHLLDLPVLQLSPSCPPAPRILISTREKGLAALSLPEASTLASQSEQREGYQACGWIFDDTSIRHHWHSGWGARLAPVERVKGVLRIPEGLVRINRQGDDLHIETQNVAPPDSRIELISSSEADWNALTAALVSFSFSHLPRKVACVFSR